MPKSAIVISKSVVPPPRSPGNPEQIVVIAPKYDTACFLAAAMVRAIAHSRNCRATYYFVDYIDRRTWPNPNCIDSNTWLYILGDFDMPAHVARAKDVGHFVSTETASVAAHFWTMLTNAPVTASPGLSSFERTWSHTATEMDWGFRKALNTFAATAVDTGMLPALTQGSAFLYRPVEVIHADCRRLYEQETAALTEQLVGQHQSTLYITEEVLDKCHLPAEWLGVVIRVVDTTGKRVDTGFLAHHVSLTHPTVDILVQHRMHQLTNNMLHKYYCRALSDKVPDLRVWDILGGHPKAASGEVHGTAAPLTDTAWLASIDDMPLLVSA